MNELPNARCTRKVFTSYRILNLSYRTHIHRCYYLKRKQLKETGAGECFLK